MASTNQMIFIDRCMKTLLDLVFIFEEGFCYYGHIECQQLPYMFGYNQI